MDEERSKQIIKALIDKGVDQPCPRCGYTKFDAVAESYLPIAGTGSWFSGDDSVPVAVIACQRCGFFSTHALGRLFQPDTPASPEPVGELSAAGDAG